MKLSRVYRTDTVETTALDGIFLDVADGEFVAIMGPSGCGKSTLLNVIGMLDSPTEGSYVFNGTEVAGLSESKLADFRKRNIGFIFQSFNLVDELSRPREYRACAALPQRPRGRAAHPGRRGDGQGGHRPPRQAPPDPAVRRPAAARRRRPGPCRQPQADPRRRADRQSRHRPWRGGDEDAAGAERRRLDHRHGHPLAGATPIMPAASSTCSTAGSWSSTAARRERLSPSHAGEGRTEDERSRETDVAQLFDGRASGRWSRTRPMPSSTSSAWRSASPPA